MICDIPRRKFSKWSWKLETDSEEDIPISTISPIMTNESVRTR